MDQDATFTPSEAAWISGVLATTQLDWRKRGLLPAGTGKWTRWSLEDVAHMRLVKAFQDAGLPVGVALTYAVRDYTAHLIAALRIRFAGDEPDGMLLAAVGRTPDGPVHQLLFGPDDFAAAARGLKAMVVLNLHEIAADMFRGVQECALAERLTEKGTA